MIKWKRNLLKFAQSMILLYLSFPFSSTFSIVKFPSFGGERFNSLLPGESWNHLVLVSLVFLAFYMKKSHVAKFAFLFSVGWFLAHGERVDMLGYMIFLFLIIYNKYEVKITIKNFKFY